MQGKHTYENVTLLQLLSQNIKERGLSRSQFIQRMGYDNVSKGLRRLDHYARTLDPPSEEFVVKLRSALEIDAQEFNRAVLCTHEQLCAAAEKAFRPYLEVLLGIQIRPALAWQLIHNRCCLAVPEKLQGKPHKEEIDAVKELYLKHVANALSESLKRRVVGFVYHRKYDRSLKFNADLKFEETITIQPVPGGKVPLGNRLANLLSAGGM